MEKLHCGTGFAEHIVNAKPYYRAGIAALADCFAYCAAQTADNIVLLCSYNAASFGGGASD